MPREKQHVELYCKLALRRALLRGCPAGAVYVPFIGDGDIAAELYADRMVYGADLDPNRSATARARLPGAQVLTADCDRWPFAGVTDEFAVADFDAYAYPYDSFRAWWANAEKGKRLVVFFTDGEKQASMTAGHSRFPDGSQLVTRGLPANQRRADFNFRFTRHCLPWLRTAAAPWRVVRTQVYTRRLMLYWGAVLERK